MKSFWLAIILVLLTAVTGYTDKSITYSTIVAADVVAMHYSIDAAGVVTLDIYAKVRGTLGTSYTARYRTVLTGAQRSTESSFITTNFLAAFNAQEGL